MARTASGDNSFKCTGTTPHAPCTITCNQNAPMPSISGSLLNAHSFKIGSDSSAAMTIARVRPMRCDKAPKNKPPMMAPMGPYVASFHRPYLVSNPFSTLEEERIQILECRG